MKNEVIYEVVKEITASQEMNMSILHPEDAVDTINFLREHVKTLITVIHSCSMETKEIRKVTSMLQKVESAKARFLEKAIDDVLRDDHQDVMSYDDRHKEMVTIMPAGKIEIHA